MKIHGLIKILAAVLILAAAAAAGAPAAVRAAGSIHAGASAEETEAPQGWVEKDGSTYYYNKEHKRVSGWQKIRKKWYYFDRKTKAMAVNQIAGDKKNGYYYVGADGIRVNNKVVNKAVEVVRSCTKNRMTEEEKVEACFLYIAKECRYQHRNEQQSAARMPTFAYEMYFTKKGNCYMSASALAYCAKIIGCPARVTVGGNSPTATGHGWAEIRVDGRWYVYDASRQRWSYSRDLSKITWKQFYNIWKSYKKYNVHRNITYLLETEGGKAVWKDVTKK